MACIVESGGAEKRRLEGKDGVPFLAPGGDWLVKLKKKLLKIRSPHRKEEASERVRKRVAGIRWYGKRLRSPLHARVNAINRLKGPTGGGEERGRIPRLQRSKSSKGRSGENRLGHTGAIPSDRMWIATRQRAAGEKEERSLGRHRWPTRTISRHTPKC